MCWDVSVADRGICRGRCPHRPVPFFENENCRGEHCSPANFSRSRQPCPKENSCNPSGGIARTSLSALGLQTPLFALSCMYNAGILNICFEYSYCFLYGVCCACFSFVFLCKISHKEFLFFFSLLKRKKEAKKEKLLAYPYSVRQCITRLAVWSFGDIQQKSPGGVIGGCCRRNTALLER